MKRTFHQKENYRVVLCRGREIVGVAGAHMSIVEADAMARTFNRIAHRSEEIAMICPMAKRIPDIRYQAVQGGAA